MSDMYRDSIFWVEVERIKPNPFQPRREFDEQKLAELADSIRMYGLLQPLTVTRREEAQEDGGIRVEYELIAGERRLRASRIAGLAQVPVIIRASEDDDKMKFELAIIENLQREDLNPIDRALAFDKLASTFQYSWAEVGRRVGRSREYVSNSVRLLALPEHIQLHLVRGNLTEGHTRPLLMLNDKPDMQEELLREIVDRKMNVRDSEIFARRAAQDRVSKRHKVDPLILSLEKQLTERLGTRVHIEPREVGGKLVISYFSAADLGTLLTAMQVEQEAIRQSPAFNGTTDTAHTSKTEFAPAPDATHTVEGDSQSATENTTTATDSARVAQLQDTVPSPSVLPDEHYPLPEQATAAEVDNSETPLPEYQETVPEAAPAEELVQEPDTPREVVAAEYTQRDQAEAAPEGFSYYAEEPGAPKEASSPEQRTPDEAPQSSETTQSKQPEQDTTAEDELYSIRNFTV